MMWKIDELQDQASCLNRAGDEEPVFVLRAADRCAPGAIRDWAHRAKGAGAPAKKVEAAMDAAIEMDKWQKANLALVKTPD